MWKDVKAIMLPTKNKSNLGLGLSKQGKLIYYQQDNDIDNDEYFQKQALYIISLDEEIKDYDWYISKEGKLLQFTGRNILGDNFKSDKVIASTNTSQTFKREKQDDNGTTKLVNCLIPQIPQQFIEEWIEEYNKKNVLEIVQVEYHDIMSADSFDMEVYCGNLKISEDNFISIKRKEQRSYTREEVETLCKNAYNYGFNGGLQELSNHHKYQHDINSINEWLTKHL